MAAIGSRKRPAIVRVQSEDRAQEVLDFCTANGIAVMVGVERDKPEDLTDIERAAAAREPPRVAAKVGRNDPCPCGSGKKFKNCHLVAE